MLARRTLTTLAVGAVLAGATAAAAPAAGPEGTTTAAERALHLRSQALNDRHGDAATVRSPGALEALALRSEGMNRYAKTLQAPAPAASSPVASTPASTPFSWDDFGAGMAAAFALVLLMGGLAVAVRTGTRRRLRTPS